MAFARLAGWRGSFPCSGSSHSSSTRFSTSADTSTQTPQWHGRGSPRTGQGGRHADQGGQQQHQREVELAGAQGGVVGELGSGQDPDDRGRAEYAVELDIISLTGGPADIVGRSVVVHANADDFRTQPAGNAGARIACGVIRRTPD